MIDRESVNSIENQHVHCLPHSMPAASYSLHIKAVAQAGLTRWGRYDPDRSRCWVLVDAGERIVAVVVLVVLLPAMLVVGAVIAMQSGRSPLVAHRRVGQFGQPLVIPKFRTMWDADRPQGRWGWMEDVGDSGAPYPKIPQDSRIRTVFARICRRWSIDELPQLVLVAAGRMALVGPRPLTRAELERNYGVEAEEVLSVKPGMTGLWQVSGRSHLTFEARLRADLRLVRHCSASLYAWILARTLFVVLRAEGAW